LRGRRSIARGAVGTVANFTATFTKGKVVGSFTETYDKGKCSTGLVTYSAARY